MYEFGPFGTRSYERHFTPNYIQQLWQFVQAESAQPASHGSDPRIVPSGPHGAGPHFGVLVHRAELIEHERSAAPTSTGLPVQNRSRVAQADRPAHQKH